MGSGEHNCVNCVVQTLSSESMKILKITDRTPRDEQKWDTDTEYDKHKKRCKSKSTNDKKWERPAGYYKEYETRRKGEGRVTWLRIKWSAFLPSSTSRIMPIRFSYGMWIMDLTAARDVKNESAYWKGAPTLWRLAFLTSMHLSGSSWIINAWPRLMYFLLFVFNPTF